MKQKKNRSLDQDDSVLVRASSVHRETGMMRTVPSANDSGDDDDDSRDHHTEFTSNQKKNSLPLSSPHLFAGRHYERAKQKERDERDQEDSVLIKVSSGRRGTDREQNLPSANDSDNDDAQWNNRVEFTAKPKKKSLPLSSPRLLLLDDDNTHSEQRKKSTNAFDKNFGQQDKPNPLGIPCKDRLQEKGVLWYRTDRLF